MLRHAMRNALLPVVTVIGLEFAFLLGGLLVTEQVFNLNGIGKLMVEAVVRRDYTMTQALIMLVGRRVRGDELPDRPALRLARPEDQLLLVRRLAWPPKIAGSTTSRARRRPGGRPGPAPTWAGLTLDFARHRTLGALGGVVIVLMLLIAAFASVVAPYDPLETSFLEQLKPPSARALARDRRLRARRPLAG